MINGTVIDCGSFLLFKDNFDGYGNCGSGTFNNDGEYPLDEAIRKDTITRVFEHHTREQKNYTLVICHNNMESVFQYTDPMRCKKAMKQVLSLINGERED